MMGTKINLRFTITSLFFLLMITYSCKKETTSTPSQVGSWEVSGIDSKYLDSLLVYELENDFYLKLLENGLGIKTLFPSIDSLTYQDSISWCWHEHNNTITLVNNYNSTFPAVNTFQILYEDENTQEWEQIIGFENQQGVFQKTVKQWLLKKK